MSHELQDCYGLNAFDGGYKNPLSERTREFKEAKLKALKVSPAAFYSSKMSTAQELERGNYFIHNNEPVRVLRKEVIVVGTHSHSKLKLYIQGLNERGERTVIFHHTDKVEIVEIIRKQGQIISKSNNKIQLMDMVTYETLDCNVPAEIFNGLTEGDQVTFIQFRGNTQILEKRQ